MFTVSWYADELHSQTFECTTADCLRILWPANPLIWPLSPLFRPQVCTMVMSRCGGRGDCETCLTSASSCVWCTYKDASGAAAATCLFEDTSNMCEDLRTVCPVAAIDESGVPGGTVLGVALGVAVASCALVFLTLYLMVRSTLLRSALTAQPHTCTRTCTHVCVCQVYRERRRRRRRRARNRSQAMARRGREVARGLEAVVESVPDL